MHLDPLETTNSTTDPRPTSVRCSCGGCAPAVDIRARAGASKIERRAADAALSSCIRLGTNAARQCRAAGGRRAVPWTYDKGKRFGKAMAKSGVTEYGEMRVHWESVGDFVLAYSSPLSAY